MAMIDRNASADALAEMVAPHWRNLRQGRYVDPTQQMKINLPLVVQGLGTVHLRDIQGGNVHAIHRNDIRAELIKDAAAFLVLAEWRGRTIDRQMEAIEPLLDFVGDRPSGLLFTKCERYLAADDDAWSLHPGWWRQEDWLSPFHAILERFGERIWPVSAYGYCQKDFAEG
ncbi:hypothetical protein, partial [Azospirillum sp. B506]|uniref:hypothetical protein n=1 Tax=Azospirillum sp. B506 TaxID=137721 RepID=UPI0011DCCD15